MVNILFCGNHQVFDGMLTCALSLMKRTSPAESFCFFIYTMDVSHLQENYKPVTDSQMAFFNEVIRKYNPENKAVKIDVTAMYKEEFSGCPNESAYCSPYTLIRLLADRVEGMPDKILYLDADVLFNRDVHLLYDTDVCDVEYAAAPDHYGKYLIHPHYINAGVLLFNLKNMKESGILSKARDVLREKKLTFADQSALIRSTTKRKLLPQKFNDQKYLHKSTVVRHFSKRLFWLPYPHTDNIKQWQVSKVHKVFRYYQFDDILYEYIYLKEKYSREVLQYE